MYAGKQVYRFAISQIAVYAAILNAILALHQRVVHKTRQFAYDNSFTKT